MIVRVIILAFEDDSVTIKTSKKYIQMYTMQANIFYITFNFKVYSSIKQLEAIDLP